MTTQTGYSTSRVSEHQYFLGVARLLSFRSTCRRRRAGCVLVDQHKHIIGTGYNGVPRNTPHCIDSPCSGASAPSGQHLDACEAVHAEINALLQCSDVERVQTIYVTCSPCVQCIKALMNTGARLLVFAELYPGWEELSKKWERSGRNWILEDLK